MTEASVEQLQAEIARLKAELEAAQALAERDVLTPVLNRRGFVRELGRAMAFCRRHGTSAVLLYLDLNGFKAINDRLGHAAGDAALVRTAEILTANLRESDAVGRLGGDEFALLLLGADASTGRDKANSLIERLAADGFAWNGETVPLAGAFGVRAFTDQDDPETWLAEADAAMWTSKPGR
ncbi:GGDEF domain-containing protein [Brevundimonas sp.]|uniref:GGDEF domain-containing protein n=1 Tax=Brevundimonas sp. TaxID=1871086 RepID=UPI0025CCAB6F|nr:GGDEF domain-containing protein [Brevundimonas sp.]